MARDFANWVDAEPGFERLAPRPFSVVCFRARPEGLEGEARRVRLSASIGSALVGVCYVLDEPSTGLDPSARRSVWELLRELQARVKALLRRKAALAAAPDTRTGDPLRVMLFGLDARGDVHWFYLAWLDPEAAPEATRLPGDVQVHDLPEGVTPENPAPGRFRVVAVFLPDEAVSPDKLDSLLMTLDELGIELIDSDAKEGLTRPDAPGDDYIYWSN